MPLLFLLSYIAISYFIFKKNKDNISNIPLIIKLTWVIAFALIFLFIVYYSEQNIVSELAYAYSFYFLLIWYIITFIVYLLKYKKIFIKNSLKLQNNAWYIETWINKIYLLVIIFLSFLYFIFTDKFDISRLDDGSQVFLYLFFILSSIYIFVEKNILSSK